MRRSRMREISVEITVGAVMFMILLALGVFTIVLSKEKLFTKYYPLKVRFGTVSGLSNGDNVFYHGVKVGIISGMEIVDEGVVVTANLDTKLKLYRDYKIRIQSASVLGGHILDVSEGTPSDGEMNIENVVLRGEAPVSLIDDASDTFAMLKKAMNEGGILKNLEESMDNIRSASRDFKDITS